LAWTSGRVGPRRLCDALRVHESCLIMIRGIARLLANVFGALVLLSATIFIIVTFNERETASALVLKTANSLWAPLQGGRDIDATNPPTHVDYLAEAALRISFFTVLVSTFGTAFTVLLGWRSDREFKLKIVQLEAQSARFAARSSSQSPRSGLSSKSRNACTARVCVSSMPGTYYGLVDEWLTAGGFALSHDPANSTARHGWHGYLIVTVQPPGTRRLQSWQRTSRLSSTSAKRANVVKPVDK
jgi:hypothetical protein